jgi:hypothetical protein
MRLFLAWLVLFVPCLVIFLISDYDLLYYGLCLIVGFASREINDPYFP